MIKIKIDYLIWFYGMSLGTNTKSKNRIAETSNAADDRVSS